MKKINDFFDKSLSSVEPKVVQKAVHIVEIEYKKFFSNKEGKIRAEAVDVFITSYLKIRKSSRMFETTDNYLRYLRIVARNTINDELRKKKRAPHIKPITEKEAELASPLEEFSTWQFMEAYEFLIRHNAAFSERDFELWSLLSVGTPTKEIASKMGFTQDSLNTTKSRLVKKIRAKIDSKLVYTYLESKYMFQVAQKF